MYSKDITPVFVQIQQMDSMTSVDPTRSWMKRPVSVSAKGGFGLPAVDHIKNQTETHASVSVKTNFSPAHVGPTENLMKTHASAYVKEPAQEINPSTLGNVPVNVQKIHKSAY